MANRDQIEHYQTHGFVVIDGVIPEHQIDAARQVVDDFVEQSRAVAESNQVFDLEPSHTANRPMVRRLKNPAKLHPLFDEIVHSATILDHLEDLVGQGVRLLGSKLNMKAADGGSPVEWHQDFAFHPHTNDD